MSCRTYRGPRRKRQAYDHAQAIVKTFDKHHACTFHVDDDLNCLRTFDDHYFDWVYVDSSHQYEHTKKELEILKDKVKPGGLITGHDWRSNPNHVHHGVYLAVREFCQDPHNWKVIKLDQFTQWAIKKI